MNDQERTHLDLFSGIGGFALAARWNGYRTVAFCEQDRFCQGVLDRWWPGVPCVQDVHDLDDDEPTFEASPYDTNEGATNEFTETIGVLAVGLSVAAIIIAVVMEAFDL